MTRIMVALVALTGLAAGLVGVIAVSQFSGSADAAPTTATREDQITIASDAGGWRAMPANAPSPVYQTDLSFAVLLNQAKYPVSTTFRLEVLAAVGSELACLRLFDVTANSDVVASEVCPTNNGGVNFDLFRSGPFTLPLADHEYRIEAKCSTSCSIPVGAIRVIAEWTERR